jgi:hypothetical protein
MDGGTGGGGLPSRLPVVDRTEEEEDIAVLREYDAGMMTVAVRNVSRRWWWWPPPSPPESAASSYRTASGLTMLSVVE